MSGPRHRPTAPRSSSETARPHRGAALWTWALVIAIAAGLGAAAYRWGSAANAPPSGPIAVAWDRDACAHCLMLVGEPRFAAQLHLHQGPVRVYDDPGCLLLDLDDIPSADIHAIYFHHLEADQWIESDRAGFVTASPTPMGFDLGVVDASAPGSVPLTTARERVRARRSRGLKEVY